MKKLPKDKQHAILVDIDGTLADESKRRKKSIFNEKIDWDKYFNEEEMIKDKVNEKLKQRVVNYKKNGFLVIILTGRLIKHKEITEKWLNDNNIPFDELVMRESGNYENVTDYKSKQIKKLQKKYFFEIAFEDLDEGIDALKIQKVPYEQIFFKG